MRFEPDAVALAFGDPLLTLALSLIPYVHSSHSPLKSSLRPDLSPFSHVPSRTLYALCLFSFTPLT
jgi:hypothetical protein